MHVILAWVMLIFYKVTKSNRTEQLNNHATDHPIHNDRNINSTAKKGNKAQVSGHKQYTIPLPARGQETAWGHCPTTWVYFAQDFNLETSKTPQQKKHPILCRSNCETCSPVQVHLEGKKVVAIAAGGGHNLML